MPLGDFANAAANDLPADDSSKTAVLDLPEKGAAPEPTKVETEKAPEKAPEPEKKEEAKKAAVPNPNLDSPEKAEVVIPAEDDDKTPAGMTAQGAQTWKSIKTEKKAALQERDAARAEVAEMRKQLEESKKVQPELEKLRKELEDTKKQLGDFEGEISVTRVEATPKYKQTVTAPLAAISSDVTEIAKRYEIAPDALLRAIQEPDAAKRADAVEEITSDMKGVDRLEVVQSAKDWQRIQRAASEMRQDAGKRLEEINRESAAMQERELTMNTRDYRAAAATQWDAIQQAFPEIRKVDGRDDWNNHLASIFKAVDDTNVNELPVEEVAKMNIAYRILPEVRATSLHYKKAADEQKARADGLQKKLDDYLKTAPGAGGGNNSPEKAKKASTGLFADIVTESEK